jgi:hypothetical protein
LFSYLTGNAWLNLGLILFPTALGTAAALDCRFAGGEDPARSIAVIVASSSSPPEPLRRFLLPDESAITLSLDALIARRDDDTPSRSGS